MPKAYSPITSDSLMNQRTSETPGECIKSEFWALALESLIQRVCGGA